MTDWVPDHTLDGPDGHTWMKPLSENCPNCDRCTARLCMEADRRRRHCAMIVDRGPGVQDVAGCPCGNLVIEETRESVRRAREGNEVSSIDEAAADCRKTQETVLPASRVQFCGRCGHAASGGYGHVSGWCNRRKKLTNGPHFCCPASCEFEDGAEVVKEAPCHPSSDEIVAWAERLDEERRKARTKS